MEVFCFFALEHTTRHLEYRLPTIMDLITFIYMKDNNSGRDYSLVRHFFFLFFPLSALDSR